MWRRLLATMKGVPSNSRIRCTCLKASSFGNASRSACGEVPQLLRDRSLLRKQLDTSSLESLCACTV